VQVNANTEKTNFEQKRVKLGSHAQDPLHLPPPVQSSSLKTAIFVHHC